MRPEKVVLFPEVGRVQIFLSLTRPHSGMCIRIYTFNWKNKTKKKQKDKEKAKKTKKEKRISWEHAMITNIWRPWKLSNFQDSPPLFPSTSKILPPNFKRKPHYLLFRDFILLCVQLSKNITKCLFLIIIIIIIILCLFSVIMYRLKSTQNNKNKTFIHK